MKKLLFRAAFGIGTLGVIASGAAAFSAFEAHIINVTATIENALSVPLEIGGLPFGTTFPQESLHLPFNVILSQSFGAQERVNVVDYTIRQKPKCGVPSGNGGYSSFPQVTEDANGNFICPTVESPAGPVQSVSLPLLCPFLSKHEITTDGNGNNDSTGINSFHGLPGPWDLSTTLATAVTGELNKSVSDMSDTWDIDLHVPCFAGNCAQDWATFVHSQNPDANPDNYTLAAGDEHKLFGCDLWLETTGISENPEALSVTVSNSQDFTIDNQNLGINPLNSGVVASSTYQYGVQTISTSVPPILTVQWKITVDGPSALSAGMVHVDELGWKDSSPDSNIETFHYPMLAIGGDLIAKGSCATPDPNHSNACLVDNFDVDPTDDFTNVDSIHFDASAPDGTYVIKRQLVDAETGIPLSNELVVATVTK
ncbi:MAG: hypothetical protein A2W52_01470 [Candidatus Taylorbacteria bacterium RIFCSPHIGHO2_02_49_25]|uniref:Uncharacterized protein n=1 Tax=Candidatus Taylorbacteria bacterium RIFCSPHIGHO2_02_49_25 TaxID=1802305 RepID=A0A1G2MFJ2_9BACT|nr:MAG: hypothetical protein UY62_C0066G0001 [Parcubacteria group bacterium GW2011_GWF2_50_9]OHA20878.1 MAG: hypothetical protein A2759_03395 [Candidatus Taylorbacteria bacterium RIFCSPHIGHO2_01_FULL_49_60]OHA21929.1 MAG: hypothetical protein A2W52_01470 [Candidatus Taylorbacteria bacterium RIFCSPHIGHO2_02_49_25]OHA35289.1 MAG: hypothetical protein A2W65_04600 [Candidatus Taylorbacteria bacterium RIFCSPLOWO2_02_50_13]OHA36556.1 MAG: hypothetical protein A3B27_02020 [Candidatus Taylorbacteria ba